MVPSKMQIPVAPFLLIPAHTSAGRYTDILSYRGITMIRVITIL